ncbi:MAG: hypothetical protein PHH20_04040, partial [Candidatus Omnitrophica bacterium]|nr:hypothetical protein [Candidatus Omnitrophota bacterium]
MKKMKLVSRILAIAGFLVTSSLIVSACHQYPIEYWIYGVVGSLLILTNFLILAAWFAFGEWGLWTYVALSSVLTLFVTIVTSARWLNIQILVFVALGVFVTIFKNSMVSYIMSIDRQIGTLE